MNNKKFIGWVIGIPVLVIVLMICIVIYEPEKEGISRAAAYKAVALLTDGRGNIEQWKKEQTKSYFAMKDQNNWYVKYMDYLFGHGLLSEELTPPSSETAEGWLTYGEVEELVAKLDPKLKDAVHAGKRNRNQSYPADEWWFLFGSLCKSLDTGEQIKELNVYLFGTPLNVDGAKEWTAYTSQGDFGFEGLALDSYIDRELKILVRGSEIIKVSQVVSDSVSYKNIWLTGGNGDTFTAHLGSIEREFPLDSSLGQPEGLLNNLADISLKKGKLQKVTLKKERITGKVLSVKEDAIEIEGYGNIKLDKDFKVYKVYGDFAQESISDILVGYDIQEFVVARGKLCAALTVREFDAKSIRVLLMNTDFQSIFHQTVTIFSNEEVTLFYGEEQEVIPAGQELVIGNDDIRLNDGRIVLSPVSAEGEITVKSIKRSMDEAPSYQGRLEINKEPEGLVLVNELYLEDYLTKVVPSEMPKSYEKEALKAQAVCARTYAYRQIQGNAYSQYGAHVDDSTRFQVYNNIATDTKTEAAVKETYGKMLFYNDEPIEAFYFSTSCGHTTDGGVWGGDPSNVPYLQGILLRDSRQSLNLTTNSEFEKFIKDKDYPSYDSAFPMYRWETTVTNEQLLEKIGGVGTILNISVTERGVGGVAKKVRVEGSDGTKTISGESQIRSRLGNRALTIIKNDGKKLTDWDTLPSAFIAIESAGVDESNITTFRIYGGGFGHGAGMSQNGAQGMAKEGKGYKEILKFFYGGVEVKEAG